ncbi:hypothetical protein [Nostoc sp. PA-18-2419]|nr:hypothetical protein [Nostoc sp. PA-18-2419]
MLACMAIAFFFLSLRIHANGKAIALNLLKKSYLRLRSSYSYGDATR